MRKTRTYQNDSPLEYGFILKGENAPSASVHDICSRALSSITIVDTEDYILNLFLKECTTILNERKVVVAGLVSKKTLSSLKGRGVNTGFFRATNETLGLGLIVIDKKEAWACFGEGHIGKVVAGSEEIFQFINHLLWTKTDNEYSFGESRQVQQTMLSVVMPVPSVGANAESAQHDFATVGIPSSKGILVKELGEYNQTAIAMPIDCRAYADQHRLFVEIIPDAFYEIENGWGLQYAMSFDPNRATPKDLVLKRIFYKGKEYQVQDVECIDETVYVPVGEAENYEPHFDSIYNNRKQITVATEINVDILPMVRDGSYQLSPNYRNHRQIEEQIQSGLEKLEKLDLDDKDIAKRIKTVQSASVFEEKVSLYNELISELDYGIEALKNKKSSFPTINQSKESFVIPHELLGTLLVKGKANYLALADESRLKEGKAWLKESGIEATLILDTEK